MTMSEADPVVVDSSLGGRLKKRREEQKLTIHDVSAQMHLEPRIIEALESEDYSNLPAPLYVRGYLRGYAKVLKIDADSLLAQFESAPTPDTPEIVPEVKHPTQTSSRDKPVRFLTYAITLTLVILLVIWWQSKFVVHNKTGRAPATQTQVSKNPLGYPIKVIHHPNVPYYRAPQEAPTQTSKRPATGGNLPAKTAANGAATASTGSNTGTDKNAGNGAAGATAASATTPRKPAAQVIVAGPDGPDHIVIHVIADSWIEIFDAHETKVYRNLARAGDVLKLSGTAPFSVLLGFTQGVTIEFNGKPFNPAPFSRSGVARFTLRNP